MELIELEWIQFMRLRIEARVQFMCLRKYSRADFRHRSKMKSGAIGFADGFCQGIHCHGFGSGEFGSLAALIGGNQEESPFGAEVEICSRRLESFSYGVSGELYETGSVFYSQIPVFLLFVVYKGRN